MKLFTICSLLFCTVLTTSAHANDTHSLAISTSLGSDYMSRGVSQTDNHATLQLSVDYAHQSGFLAGLFLSNVDFNSSAYREQDVYLGYTHDFANGVGIDGYVWYYDYQGESVLNFPEYNLGVRYQWVDARYWYSNNFSGTGGEQHYYEAGLTIPLSADFNLGLRAGHSVFDSRVGTDDYNDYILSLSTSYHGFDLSLFATATDSHQSGDLEDSRLVFTVSKTFDLLP